MTDQISSRNLHSGVGSSNKEIRLQVPGRYVPNVSSARLLLPQHYNLLAIGLDSRAVLDSRKRLAETAASCGWEWADVETIAQELHGKGKLRNAATQAEATAELAKIQKFYAALVAQMS